MLSFKRGVKVSEVKPARNSKIEELPIPKRLTIPLLQHIGRPAKPIVKVGEYVRKYQKIAESDGKISANIHTSSSGTVKLIDENIVIETDQKDEAIELKGIEADNEKLIEYIRESGIVGLGGACFPTDVKLSCPDIDEFILNGCECEPYLSSDYRLLLEFPEEIICGMHIMMRSCNAKKGIIGIEDNKKDVYENISKIALKKNIKTSLLKTKYPQGAEKMLIYALTKKKVSTGCLPADVGCIVNNVATAKAVYDSVTYGRPLIERVVTVSGHVNRSLNVTARVGTPINELLELAGLKKGFKKIILGGPMMGKTVTSLDEPITKGTNGITVLDYSLSISEHCIRCGRCVKACPMGLVPTKIAKLADKEMFDEAKKAYAMDCMECGCCSYVCPSAIPLVQYIRLAKEGIKK